MERMAWKGKIKPGAKDEYVRRHDELWPEMAALLKEAGICNYTIFNTGDELFGYYECEKGITFAEKTQAGSPVVDRWNDYMKDVMVMEVDPETGTHYKLEQVFFHP
jgi:L-rhamnose mutarotase